MTDPEGAEPRILREPSRNTTALALNIAPQAPTMTTLYSTLEAAARIATADQLLQPFRPGDERLVSQILPIEVQQVERHEHEPLRLMVMAALKAPKSVLVLDDISSRTALEHSRSPAPLRTRRYQSVQSWPFLLKARISSPPIVICVR